MNDDEPMASINLPAEGVASGTAEAAFADDGLTEFGAGMDYATFKARYIMSYSGDAEVDTGSEESEGEYSKKDESEDEQSEVDVGVSVQQIHQVTGLERVSLHDIIDTGKELYKTEDVFDLTVSSKEFGFVFGEIAKQVLEEKELVRHLEL